MIKAIAAIDKKRGIAKEDGIPWDISVDRQYFRDKTFGGSILMGFNTYSEFDKPWENRQNYVYCRPGTNLREGFIPVHDPVNFLKNFQQDIWVIGGQKLFEDTIDVIDALYLTHIDHDFRCTKHFPSYKKYFRRKRQSPDHHQNGLTFRFEVWERLKLNNPKARKV